MPQLITFTAVTWSLFQLWIASPLPFELGIGVFNNTETRAIHLGFAIFLAFVLKLADKPLAWRLIPALVAAFCATYLFWFYAALANRAGAPTTTDIVVAIVGIALLLEATRRTLGWTLSIVAGVFLLYTFIGPYMPDVMAYKGASLARVASHQWLGTEGVFGVALGVSTGFVFLFVLFGAMLQTAGAGRYFILLAFALLGHMRGGPAKAGVLASGLTGLMSGSSIANVVTTGTFTIPLMKRVGFPAYKAGAIEVAASTNGQILPPVMGAAAFLMVEYTGTSYQDVIKHAFWPALLSYMALMFMVHLEAVKADMQGLQRLQITPLKARLLGWGLTISGAFIFIALAYWGLNFLQQILGSATLWVVLPLLLLLYLGLLWHGTRQEKITLDLEHITHVPPLAKVANSGLHFLLPVLVLVWCLLVLELSPGLSAFYACVAIIVILLTQRPLQVIFQAVSARNKPSRLSSLSKLTKRVYRATLQGLNDLKTSLKDGALNMVGVGLATATAGIVVGTVSLTGVGLVLTEVVEILSMGSLPLVLVLTAIFCMLLGMGLPTTANYIVVSTLMAPVIISLSQSHGLELPLIAVHLFVFYFGILADDTPPVGLAAFAASGIARSDPIYTGLQSFAYDIRTAILPFMFIFNTEMLMIGIESWGQLLWMLFTSFLAMMLFVSVTQGWLLVRMRWWEGVALLLVVFSLFRPGFWLDRVYPPYQEIPLSTLTTLNAADTFRLHVEVDDGINPPAPQVFSFTMPDTEDPLATLGLGIEDGWINDIGFMSPAENAGLSLANDNRLLHIEVTQEQANKNWFTLPAFLLLGLIVWAQWRRRSASNSSHREL
jgi:TRAP transporter 4TM/12TM fusion protein